MDGERLAAFPHLSWLGFRAQAAAGPRPLPVRLHGVVHIVSLTVAGRHAIRWIRDGRETRWTETAGTVHFLPADGEQNTFLATPEPRFESAVLAIPPRQLAECLASDELEARGQPRRLLAPDDPVLRACMWRLTARGPAGAEDADAGRDEAAYTLVRRLHVLCGGGQPDWQRDSGTFGRRALAGLVEHIDAHLRLAPSLADMARLVGISPSHFAKKFRASTGLSLHRFVNRRRLQAALDILRTGEAPLAGLAGDLGFSSQSHFTRLFSELTGMTPSRYRRQCAPTLG